MLNNLILILNKLQHHSPLCIICIKRKIFTKKAFYNILLPASEEANTEIYKRSVIEGWPDTIILQKSLSEILEPPYDEPLYVYFVLDKIIDSREVFPEHSVSYFDRLMSRMRHFRDNEQLYLIPITPQAV